MSKLQGFTTKIKRLIYSFQQIFFEKEEEPKSITSLAAKVLKAKDEIKKIQPYLDRLNSSLSSEDITNIAITGTYGSGKSTVIKTFQDIHKAEDPKNKYKYLNISLASFKDELLDEQEENGIQRERTQLNQENFERLLEVSILQQMIYHVKPSRIPNSRFKRITNFASEKLVALAIGIVIWLISIFCIWKFDFFNKMNPTKWTFSSEDFDLTSFIVIAVFLSGLVNIIIKLIRTFGNSRISKINIKGELELGENVDKSILNQHLDEIIYFFQMTGFNVVVIEDLDRFKDTEIFTKLREINLLLNSSELIKKKIAFVYAIRDDMFHGHERIKFFDYIIPVIPFINPSNANDKFAELLIEAKINEDFTPSFIDDVVTFINDIDMRLLINILQEYLVYKESLKHDLEQDNLLAIIIYKNIYPRDFAKLHKNEGNLYDFISSKRLYIEDLITDLDEEIKTNQTLIANIEEEVIENEKELREIYLYNLLVKLNNPVEIILGDKAVSINKLSEDENFYALMEENKIQYKSLTTNHVNSAFYKTNSSIKSSFSDIEKTIDPQNSYSDRLQLIESKSQNEINVLTQQIESNEERKVEIKGWDIKQIFQMHDLDGYLGNFEKSNLMRSLLVNGYINENYLDYISLFHEVNITGKDYAFIRRVRSSKSSDFDYKLEKLENTILRLNESNFEKVAILNHEVVEFILKNKNKYESRYKSLKKLLKSENKKVIDFIDSYRRSNLTENSILFKALPKIWLNIWNFISTKSKYSKEKTNDYFQLIISNTALSDLEKLINIESFKENLVKLSNLGNLLTDKNYTGKLKSAVTKFKTKFKDISELKSKNEDLFNYVLNNNHYEINTANLLAVAKNESVTEEDFNNANYSVLKNLKNKFTGEYIDREIEMYVTTVFLTLENSEESEDALTLLLNNEGLTIRSKRLILESTTPMFLDLSVFNNIEVKEDILKQFSISISWKNVMHYFNTYTRENLDSILIDYLNNEEVYKELSKSDLTSLSDDDEARKKLSLAIIYCDDLSLESHAKLRTCEGTGWEGLILEKLSYDKVESMIESRFIFLSVDYYDKLKENFSDLHIKLIERDFTDYIEAHYNYEMNEKDHLSMLQSTFLTSIQKRQFLDTLEENEITENEAIAISATKVYVNESVDSLSYNFLYGLFDKGNSNEHRIRLFNLNFNRLSKAEAKSLIEHLGSPYNRLIIPRKQEKLNINAVNVEFTDNLKKLNIITSNKEVKNMIKAVASSS